jgi:four helix bundle protein
MGLSGVAVAANALCLFGHHSLVAWQRADDLFIELHKLSTQLWPASERFELGSQTRRAAYSVAANIVEGSARDHVRERLQFLNTARSSLAELGYCVHAAARLGYLTDAQRDALEVKVKQTSAALNGYIRSMSAREH